jgi:hypothetical protein
MRAGLQPARVFGRLGHPEANLPLRMYPPVDGFEHGDWWSPWLPTWALRATPETCKVLAGALRRYGMRSSTASMRRQIMSLIDEPAAPAVVDIAEDSREWHLADRTPTDGVEIAGRVFCSYPLAYVLRRYGEGDIAWMLGGRYLTAWYDPETAPTCECVGVFSGWHRDALTPGPPSRPTSKQ